MANVVVLESVEELKRVERQQTRANFSKRVRALLVWKQEPQRTRASLAGELHVWEEALARWATLYTEGGLEALLCYRPRGVKKGRVVCIAPDAFESLRLRLHGEGFSSFKEAWRWLVEEKGQASLKYDTLVKLIHREFGGRLKRPRPVHEKKTKRKAKGSPFS